MARVQGGVNTISVRQGALSDRHNDGPATRSTRPSRPLVCNRLQTGAVAAYHSVSKRPSDCPEAFEAPFVDRPA